MPAKTELRAKLEALLREEGASFGSDALAGDLVDVIERGGVLRLEPEEAKLPKRLQVVRLASEDWQRQGKKGWFAKVIIPDDLIVAVVLGGWTQGAAERRVSLLEEAVAAYNREREEEARNSCGARTLPGESHRCSPSEPSPEWPERLMVAEDGSLAVSYGSMIGGFGCRRLMGPEVNEAARRWEEEPRLRARIGEAVGRLLRHFDLALEHQVAADIYRILTGKAEQEESRKE
jgi:hypothetical protein